MIYNRKIERGLSRNKSQGFSLIELMFAMFIFATCLLMIFGVFPTAMRAVSQGKYKFLAAEVAQKQLEQLKKMAMTNYGDLNPDNDAIKNPDDIDIETWTNGVHTVITLRPMIDISVPEPQDEYVDPDHDNPATPEYWEEALLKRARVTVNVYMGGEQATRPEYMGNVTLQTLIAKP